MMKQFILFVINICLLIHLKRNIVIFYYVLDVTILNEILTCSGTPEDTTLIIDNANIEKAIASSSKTFTHSDNTNSTKQTGK